MLFTTKYEYGEICLKQSHSRLVTGSNLKEEGSDEMGLIHAVAPCVNCER